MAYLKRKEEETSLDQRIEFLKIHPAVGSIDPQQQRGYAIQYKVDGFGPLMIITDSWDHDHLLHHSRLTCQVKIIDAIRAIDGVTITNVSQPVILSGSPPVESFNVEFMYKHHGPFSVWESFDECTGDVMVPRAQYYIDTINKITSIRI